MVRRPGARTAVLGLALLAATAGGATAQWDDVTVSSDIEFLNRQDPITNPGYPSQIMGAGAAWFDYNNDGYEDLYATQSDGCNKLFENLLDY